MAATETSARAAAELDELYRRHVGDVYRYTYAVLGNHADAEDVTQTTFVNALRALERGESPRAASTWLIAIAQNVVRQRWRHASSRPTEVELVNDVPETPPDDDIELDELVRALQRIPPAQREALVLRELEGRPYSEIAELLGLTTSALETLLFRARRSLAEELEALVTCQTAELAISKQLDGRLGRKERRRLDEHLAECEDCSRLAATTKRQRRAFKGLAVLPLPVGLALFKGAPSASAAASLPTIGLGAGTGANGVGSAGVGATGATGTTGATTIAAGTAVGGSFVAIAVKVAAVIIVGAVATGAGYKGLQAVLDEPGPAAGVKRAAAAQKAASALLTDVKTTAGKGRAAPSGPGPQSSGATSSAVAAVAGVSAGSSGDKSTGSASPGLPTTPVAGGGGPRAAAPSGGSAEVPNASVATAPNATKPKAPTKAKAKKAKAQAKSPTVTPKPKPTPAPPKATPTPPALSPTPPPTGPGSSNSGGVPSDQGKPADPGKPADTGKPEDSGKPTDAGNGGANEKPSDPAPSSSSSSSTPEPSSSSSFSSSSSSTPSAPTTGSPTLQGSTSTSGANTTISGAESRVGTDSSTSSSSNGCPGGGNGPGNGAGCGVGNANGQAKRT